MFDTEEEKIFNTLFEAIPEAVVLIDEFQKIKEINSSTQEMFGYSKEELLHESIEKLILNKYRENAIDHFKFFFEIKEKRKLGRDKYLFAVHKRGSFFPIELGLNPLEIHGKKYIMAMLIDISYRKDQEVEVLALNAELENSVKERTKKLSHTVEKLEKINQQLDEENKKRIEAEERVTNALNDERELNGLKTKLLSMVSHEFKTPLTGISISTMLLAKYKLTDHQEKREKHLSIINSKVQYLNNILNNFLSIEKLEKGEVKYNPTTFEIKNIVDEVIDGASLLLKEGQEITCITKIDGISMYQDEKIIELTLSNLLSNAIKYSRENSQIHIDIKQNTEDTIIKVIDKGFGIPQKEQKNIFKRYYRAENVLLIEGTGIGLNIIYSHLNNLGGEIAFESKLNVGTTVTVTLPNKIEL